MKSLKWAAYAIFALTTLLHAGDAKPSQVEIVLHETKPLQHPRGTRLPLYFWTPEFSEKTDDAELESEIKELDARGISLFARWRASKLGASAAFAIRIAKLEKKLGIPVSVIGENDTTNGFCDSSPAVAHKDSDGKPFFDTSFFWKPGCPFCMSTRYEPMKAKLEPFLKKYQENGVPLDLWTADFEFDGPIEWNAGWATAKKCALCREKIKNLDTDFPAFQTAVRTVRTEMQNEVFSKTIKKYFPDARIGVYGMNPHDGYRYWWDFFEKQTLIDGVAYKNDQGGVYRPWAKEFEGSGYTMAMPVIYSLYNPYTFKNGEYGWFYNMLLEYSSAAKNTPANVALVPFVHWSITAPKGLTPLSEQKYEELLWHLLLRRCDSFCMWCTAEQTAKAAVPVQKVYAESLQYGDFLNKGTPITFDVPAQPGTVISGLKLGNRVLVRRTDFEGNAEPVATVIEQKTIQVPAKAGACQIIDLP